MKIQFNDLSIIHNEIKTEVFDSINKIIGKNSYILSNHVQNFEEEFSKFCKSKYAVGCGNGYDALLLAIKSLKLRKNSEVIVPAMTYAATAFAVVNAGLKLKLVDVDECGLIDLNEVENSITAQTQSIIPVHLYGQSVNMKELLRIKKNNKIKLVEDCAQAHGGFDTYSKKELGCIGDIACYSFYPGKNLGAFGDAGAIVTNNKNIYNKLKAYRALGSSKKYFHDTFGVNSRLDEIQAAILRIKLKRLKTWNKSRQQIGNYYLKNIKFNEKFRAINTTKGSVFHIFNLLVPNRNKFINAMNEMNIPTVMHYPRSINQHKELRKLFNGKSFKNAETIASNSISIPIFPFMPKSHIDYVVSRINFFIKNN